MRFRFGSAYEGLDTKKGKIILVNILLFYLRRASLVFTVVYKMDNLTLQIIVLFSTTLIQSVVIAGFNVYQDRAMNRAELVNEVFTMFIMYGTFLFTDYLPDAKTKFQLGFVFSALILLHLVLNLGEMVRRNFTLSTRALYANKKLKEAQSKRSSY